MDETRARRSLADDPTFLASLTDLDRGLHAFETFDRNHDQHAAKTTPYEPIYGFRENPFTLSSDPQFVFHSVAHDRTAQDLLTAIRERTSILIAGSRGIGKTMLCSAVIEQLDRRTLTSFLAEPLASVEALLQRLLLDFGVVSADDLQSAAPSRKQMRTALHSFLASLSALEANAVVIIDEAQDLPISVLDEIRALVEHGDTSPPTVVVVGEPSLAKLLKRSTLRWMNELITVRSELGPLAASEISGYISHRLAVAGGSSEVEFSDDAMRRIFELSEGVPRTVNLLCDRALARGSEQSTHEITAPLVDAAADELEIDAPQVPATTAVRVAGSVAALVGLMLLGAAAAAWVFQDQVHRTVRLWEQVPPPPPAPIPRTAPPLRAIPPPRDVR